MAALLEIRDGTPWYLSEDVWTVPDDPDGTPGQPIVGRQCYVWARVTNHASESVSNATVRFYWADPSTGFDRNTAHVIGTAYVSFDGAGTQDVLCLTQWTPTFVNGGHECVLAEAFHPTDALPATLDFNVPTDRHVAQRNLSVIIALGGHFHMAFEIHNRARVARQFRIVAAEVPVGRLAKLVSSVEHLPGNGKVRSFGLVKEACPSDQSIEHALRREHEVEVPAFGRMGLAVAGVVEEGAVGLNVAQYAGNAIVGGLALIVVRGEGKETK
jgi:hypothetical protein